MKVRRIHGALNVEFDDLHFLSFTIMDKACDQCDGEGDCQTCDAAWRPWNEYYQFIKYDFEIDKRKEKDKISYEYDKTKAIKTLIRMLQDYLDAQTDEEVDKCIAMEK